MTTKMHEYNSILDKKICVWIVDDNARYCAIVADTLNESNSIQCNRRFHQCATLFSALKASIGLPDVILLDVQMPGISGLDSIPTIKEMSPGSKIIILTAFDNDSYILKAVREGTSGFLLKDSSVKKMVDAIQTVAAGGAAMDSRALAKLLKMLSDCNYGTDMNGLTPREKEIVDQMVKGLSNKQIADELNMSPSTMFAHVRSIFKKFDVHNRTTLAAEVNRKRLI